MLKNRSYEDQLSLGDNHKYTPLHLATYWDHDSCVSRLLSYSSVLETINEPSIYGYTALHNAAISYSPKCMKLLLEMGGERIEVNHPNEDGNTPLHLGIYCSENVGFIFSAFML